MARATVFASDVLGDGAQSVNEFVHWAGVSNARVTFDFGFEQRYVSGVQSLALRRSENEISSLEAARTDSDDSEVHSEQTHSSPMLRSARV